MTWLFKGKTLDEDNDIPDDAFGFIYLIRDKETGRRYVGRKLLTKAARRQRKGKVRRVRVESDWREYWSSSPDVQRLVEDHGTDRFEREILCFAPGKAVLNYLEEKILYSIGAIESDDFYNSNIRSKMYERHIRGNFDVEVVDDIIDSLKNDRSS